MHSPRSPGNGYAAALIWEVVRNHRRAGDTSWMHVGSANRRAIDLYLRMGFTLAHEVTLCRATLRNR